MKLIRLESTNTQQNSIAVRAELAPSSTSSTITLGMD